jgi:hypothetical protein
VILVKLAAVAADPEAEATGLTEAAAPLETLLAAPPQPARTKAMPTITFNRKRMRQISPGADCRLSYRHGVGG